MKKIVFSNVCLTAIMLLLTMSFVSCKDDKVTDDDDVTIIESVGDEFNPTVLLEYSAYVAPTVDANLCKAIKWAVRSVETNPDDDLEELYVINKLTDIDEVTLETAYNSGSSILLAQPVQSEIKAYVDAHDWLDLDPTVSESTMFFGFSSDTKALIDNPEPSGDPVYDNSDLDKKYYVMLSGYISSIQLKVQSPLGGGGSGSGDGNARIEDVFQAYHFVHTHTYNAHVRYSVTWGEEYYLNGTGACTTLLDVYPIHVYEGEPGAGDYFAVRMNTSVANGNMWRGKGWNRRIGIYIRHCGFWCNSFETLVDPMMSTDNLMSESNLQFLASCPPTPETTRNATTYQDSKSFSLNVAATGKKETTTEIGAGAAGAKPKSTVGGQVQVSLGWTWSHNQSYTIQNVEIEDHHSLNRINWKIKFNDVPYFKWLEDYGFKITESLPYRSTQSLNASWLWYDPTAKDETNIGPLRIRVKTHPSYEMQTFWTTEADLESFYYNSSKTEYFDIPRPNNKRAGEIEIVNNLKDEMTISDVKVIYKGTDEVVGEFPQTIPNGESQSLGWYLQQIYKGTNSKYVITFMAKKPGETAKKYNYSLNDGFEVVHKSKVKLYALDDFTAEE